MNSFEATAAIRNTLQQNKMLEAESQTLRTTIRVIEKSAMEMSRHSQKKQGVKKYPSYTVPMPNYQTYGGASYEDYDTLLSNLAKCEDYPAEQLLEGLNKEELTNAMHSIQTLAQMQKQKVEVLAQEVDHLNRKHCKSQNTDEDIFESIANGCLADAEMQRKVENNFEQKILQLETENRHSTLNQEVNKNARMQVYNPFKNVLTPEVIGQDQVEIKFDNRFEKTTALSYDQNQLNQPPEMDDLHDKPVENVIHSCKAQAEKQAKLITALTEAINMTGKVQTNEKRIESIETLPIVMINESPSETDGDDAKKVQESPRRADNTVGREEQGSPLETDNKDVEEKPVEAVVTSGRKFYMAALAAIPIAGASAAGVFAYLRHIK